MVLHKDLIGSDIHVANAFTFVNAAARVAATVVVRDIGKIAKQTDNDSFYILIDTAPTWSQINVPPSGSDTYLGLTDTPGNFSGEAGKIVQVNAGETALEHGQKLTTADSPQFAGLTLTGDLNVQGTTTAIDTLTLQVKDKNIELGKVDTPTDVTADGGGITLKGDTDKTIIWRNNSNTWQFNQAIDLQGNILFGVTVFLVGNLQLLANTLSSTDTNGNIIISPNGTGDIGLDINGVELVRLSSLENNVGIGGFPSEGAILDLSSTNKGFLKPRLTSTERDELPAIPVGLEFYNTTLDKQQFVSPVGFKTVLTEDIGHIVVQDSFASTNVRYFGELGLPGLQVGWTETGTGVISIFNDNVFGVVKDVVKHFSTTGNSTNSKSSVTGADWDNILAFGASFSGITRITEDINTNSIFAGVGFSPVNDPRASSIESRVGMFISVDATHTNLRLDGSALVTFDGQGGRPLILKDEWFKWEAVVNPTPDAGANFGVVDVYVNNILVVTGAIVASNNAVSDIVDLQNSSSSGQTTFYVDNFGITIYEESSTKTLSAVLMSSDVAQITIPEGRRDYTIILPDGNPRDIGSLIRVVVNNLFGKVTFQNETPAAPEALFNGLADLTFNVFAKEIVGGINTVDQANVYIGFKAEDVDRSPSVFAQLSSSVDQIPTATAPKAISFDTQDAINGIFHSTSVNPEEIEILPGFEGTYFVSPQPQVGKDSGGAKVDFDMFLQVDRGSGFVDEPNSNIKLSIKDADITDVIVSAFTVSLNAGDKIKMMQRVSSSTVGMGLKATAAEVGPPTIPATPAIILTMHRVGGI